MGVWECNMARWPNPLPPPGTVQHPSLEKRRGWDLFWEVPSAPREQSTAGCCAARQRSEWSSSHSLCVCAKDRTLECLRGSVWRRGFPAEPACVSCATGGLHSLMHVFISSCTECPPCFLPKYIHVPGTGNLLSLCVVLSTPTASWLKAVMA